MTESAESRTIRLAAVQWSPAFHDARAATKKTILAIEAAAGDKVDLLVFPETWLAGYPYWASLSIREPSFTAYRRLFQGNAVPVPGPEIDRIATAAGQTKTTVVLGVNEKDGGTIYNTQVFIGANGKLLGKHRKLVPTATERLVHGRGDGSDLLAHETGVGRISGLICFEHQMAPARYLLNAHGVQIHASAWPGHPFLNGVIDASARQLAMENGCFVVVAREIMDVSLLPDDFPDPGEDQGRWAMRGGSSIVAPDGTYIVEPVFDNEQLIVADANLQKIDDAKWMLDGVGHYARPDVFQLQWHQQPKPPVVGGD